MILPGKGMGLWDMAQAELMMSLPETIEERPADKFSKVRPEFE
jgi:hypothetical protein